MIQDPSHPTGVAPEEGEDERTPGLVRARERKAHSAVQLRVAGASWDQIAQVMGYPTARAALVATEQALEAELLTEQSQASMRSMAGRRLERLLQSVWPKAVDANHPEHLVAVHRARDIVDRHARLYGLDAPTQIRVHSPSQAELEAWVARVHSIEVPQLPEADIFDVVEGEFSEEMGDADA